MLSVTILCVGKMREKHYIAAFAEYEKRLGAFCRFELQEIPEQRLPDRPAPKEIDAALADYIERLQNAGTSHLCFIVGGSFGLSERVKAASSLRLSMSAMTFPHHLARVMLAEQIYRAFTILNGSQYHK